MKFNTIYIGLIAAAAALAGTPAYAGPDQVSTWVNAVNKKLERTIVYPPNGRHGVAHATFRRTADGRAELVSVKAKSASVARAARLTVARLRDLPPEPTGMSGRNIVLQMLIGNPNDARSYYHQRAQMLASAETGNRQVAARMAGSQLASTEVR